MEQEPSSCGDGRLDRANGCIQDRLPSHGCDGISVRRLGGNQAGEIRMGRLVQNGKVTADRIIEPVAAATSSRVGGLPVLSTRGDCESILFRHQVRNESVIHG